MSAAYLNLIEFRGRDGSVILQRAEDLSTIIISRVPVAKGSTETREDVSLLLRNNNRLPVEGETRESIIKAIRSCTGTIVSVIEREEPPAG